MGRVETERKFLVDRAKWIAAGRGHGILYRQGYLCTDPATTVRVRLEGDRGTLTIKGPGAMSRSEYEYEIPAGDAEELLHLAAARMVEKTRTRVRVGDHTWEVDEFHGANAGLLMAEIELESPDEPFEQPEWAEEEVTGDPRYHNSWLAEHPFSGWKKENPGR